MARRPRYDRVGLVHHVVNRGVGKRPIFELRRDYRYFLTLLACAARAGRIRVLAFCLMSNHFHVVVESLDGDISETFRRIQCLHAARFNATRSDRRTGHLFEGRFYSTHVESRAYLYTLIAYLDSNPVEAGLSQDPLSYKYGSAQYLSGFRARPAWLSNRIVQWFLGPCDDSQRAKAYLATFRSEGSKAAQTLIRQRLSAPRRENAGDDLDWLLGGDAARRMDWLRQQALAGDGTSVSLPMVDPASVAVAISEGRELEQDPGDGRLAGTATPWEELETGLLLDLAGLTAAAASRHLGITRAQLRRRRESHGTALHAGGPYAQLAASVARAALLACYGPRAEAVAQSVVRARLGQP